MRSYASNRAAARGAARLYTMGEVRTYEQTHETRIRSADGWIDRPHPEPSIPDLKRDPHGIPSTSSHHVIVRAITVR